MKKLIFNLIVVLLVSVPLAGQEYHNVKIYKHLKKCNRDTLVQSDSLHTVITIDTTKKLVRIYSKEDQFLIRGIWLKRIGPNQFEFSKKIDWHPLSYATCQLEVQPDKIILYTHYKYHWKKFKYSIVFF